MTSAVIRDFGNVNILTVKRIKWVKLHQIKNFVATGRTIAEIWRFFRFFQDGGGPPS